MTTVTTMRKQIVAALGVLAAVLGVAACGSDGKGNNSDASAAPASATTTLPQGSEAVDLKPAEDVPLAVEFRRRSGDVILSRGYPASLPFPRIVSGFEAFPGAPAG